MTDYEKCIYFSYEYISSWHSDIFDHPDYECYCSKSGKKQKLFIGNCLKCKVGKVRKEGNYYAEEKNYVAEAGYEMGKMEME